MGNVPPEVRHEDKDEIEELRQHFVSPPFTEYPEEHIFFRWPAPPSVRHHHQAMHLFPDGGFVRLRSRGTGKYVHADDDGVGVSLRRRATLNTVWRVQHLVVEDEGEAKRTFLLLQGAAYGRYLAISPRDVLPGLPGLRVVQRDLDLLHFPGYMAFRWTVERVDADGNCVRVIQYDLNLRANGSYCSGNTGVTADSYEDDNRITTMRLWTVQLVPAGPAPAPAPLPLPVTWQAMIHGGRCCALLFWRRAEHYGKQIHGGRCCDLLLWQLAGSRMVLLPRRRIYYVRVDDDGNFYDDQTWFSCPFHGRSVFNLRAEVAHDLEERNGDISAFILCVRAGLDARLMPLVTDLPRSKDPMLVVALRTGSPAAQALVYPQI